MRCHIEVLKVRMVMGNVASIVGLWGVAVAQALDVE